MLEELAVNIAANKIANAKSDGPHFPDLFDGFASRIEACINAALDDAIERVVTGTRIKGKRVVVFDRQAQNALSDVAVDCRGFNAINLAVESVTGTTPSATISVEGAAEQGGNYLPLDDPNASQASVTSTTSFDVMVGTAWAKIRIASISGTFGRDQGYTVVVTPYVAAAQPETRQATHDRLQGNATLQVADVDVSNSNPVPVEPAKGANTFSAVTFASNPVPAAAAILAANAARKAALLVNAGSNTVYLGKDNTVTTANGVPLAPGASLSDERSTSAWWGIMAANQAGDVRVVEVA